MTTLTTQAPESAEPASTVRVHSELEKLLAKELTSSRDLPVIDGVVVPKSAEGIYRLAQWYVTAGMVPDSLRGADAQATTAKVSIAISAGMAVGLTHTQAVANVMVVNNRPAMWGDAIVAVVRRSPQCVEIIDSDDGTEAVCRAVRMKRLADGSFHTETREARFSMKDAGTAGLLNKGPWKSAPARMRQNRARAFALRDLFADLLLGVGVVEEEQDIEAMRRTESQERTTAAAQQAVNAAGAAAPPSVAPAVGPVPEGGLGVPRLQRIGPPVAGPGDSVYLNIGPKPSAREAFEAGVAQWSGVAPADLQDAVTATLKAYGFKPRKGEPLFDVQYEDALRLLRSDVAAGRAWPPESPKDTRKAD